MTPLEFVEFVASGDAAKFVLEHGFAALKLRAQETLKSYDEAYDFGETGYATPDDYALQCAYTDAFERCGV